MRRLLTAVAAGLVVVLLTAGSLDARLTLRPLPTIDGYYRFLGLHERAEVIRDGFGVPRIYANNAHDLFFLQGYVTAQDRFAQMEAMRAALPLGHAFGGDLDHGTASALAAYAAGVTKYVEQHADARALPAEIALSGMRPAPWTSDDSLGLARLAPAWPLMSCLALGPDRTVRGAPLLAAELVTAGPAPGWYEVGLAAPGIGAIGISLPGVPGILAGHNGAVAWAIRHRDADVAALSVGALVARRASDLAAGAGCAADRAGAAVGGDPLLVDRRLDVEDLRRRFGEPVRAPGARVVIDLGDLDATRAALSTGQSGHPASRHYMDQKQLWAAGQLHRLVWTRERIARVDGELVLRPR